MILGGTVTGEFKTPEEWEELLIRSGFKAITAPFCCEDDENLIRKYMDIIERNHVKISEIGVWRNILIGQDIDYAVNQLKLADKLGIECCVNIVGTVSSLSWDAADVSNFTDDNYVTIVKSIRQVIDKAAPTKAYYTVEPMPWMIPDGPDVYLKLIDDVDRERFAVHMDFVNMINSPRRFLCACDFVEDCFKKLSPFIKSTHIKDSRMNLTKYTTHIDECPPGEGNLDYPKILQILDKYLPKDGAILLEHMSTFEEYDKAFKYVKNAAEKAGVEV
ncbi:sugar phosphate isomerase/epimerase family protein [Eubacterium ruminantium]|uniref:sugar phosphate isomerase/epimerase family protein n=1 Tax=Eubacterium ruminantium TaxID=42322 RepID=UPI001568C412|nr:sugar phosphate isomerase/epimerase [Eubacterium ruminantium]